MSILNIKPFSRYALLFINKTFQRDTRKKNAKKQIHQQKQNFAKKSFNHHYIHIICTTSGTAIGGTDGGPGEVCITSTRWTSKADRPFGSSFFLLLCPPASLNTPLKPALSSRTARTWFSPLEVTYIQPPRALFSIPKAPRSRRHCHTSLWTNNWDAPAEERRGSEELKPLWVSLLTSRSMIALILWFLNPLLFYHCFFNILFLLWL